MAKKAETKVTSITNILKAKASLKNRLMSLGACLLSVSYRKNKVTQMLEPLMWLQRADAGEHQEEYEAELQKLNEKYDVTFVALTGVANVPQRWAGNNGFNNENFVKQIESATEDLKKETAAELGTSAGKTDVPNL